MALPVNIKLVLSIKRLPVKFPAASGTKFTLNASVPLGDRVAGRVGTPFSGKAVLLELILPIVADKEPVLTI